MKNNFIALILALFMPYTLAQAKTDQEWEDALLGAWEEKRSLSLFQAGGKLSLVFMPDGKFSISGKVYNLSKSIPFMFQGYWKVVDGWVHYEITKSTIQRLYPIGTEMQDKIIYADKWGFVYMDGQTGKKITMKRLYRR